MFMTQILRRRGLNLQSSKTEMVRREDARDKIEGITPLLQAVQERYKISRSTLRTFRAEAAAQWQDAVAAA
jgi:hypothetical protein